MFKKFRRLGVFVGLLGDIQALVTWLVPPSVLSGAVLVSALQTVPLYLAIFVAAGAFAVGTIILFYGQLLYRQNAIFRQLVPLGFVMKSCLQDSSEGNTFGVTLVIDLYNASHKTLYIKAKRTMHQIEGITPKKSELPELPYTLVPRQRLGYQLAPIHGLAFKKGEHAAGKVEIEFYYGATPDNMKYIMLFEGKPILYPAFRSDTDEAVGAQFIGSLDKIEHLKTEPPK